MIKFKKLIFIILFFMSVLDFLKISSSRAGIHIFNSMALMTSQKQAIQSARTLNDLFNRLRDDPSSSDIRRQILDLSRAIVGILSFGRVADSSTNFPGLRHDNPVEQKDREAFETAFILELNEMMSLRTDLDVDQQNLVMSFFPAKRKKPLKTPPLLEQRALDPALIDLWRDSALYLKWKNSIAAAQKTEFNFNSRPFQSFLRQLMDLLSRAGVTMEDVIAQTKSAQQCIDALSR